MTENTSENTSDPSSNEEGSEDGSSSSGKREIFTPYIIRNGTKIYPKNAEVFHFYVED